jgi:integrase
MVLGPGTPAEAFPWPSLDYEFVMRLRRGLYDQTLEEAITPGTANLTLSHLRGIIRTMYRMGFVSQETHSLTYPRELKPIPGSRVSRGDMLRPADERALRAAALDLDGYRGAMLDAAIVLAIGCGLRREEVATVTLDQLQPGLVSIIGKGSKEREIPTDEKMDEVLNDWLKERARHRPKHETVFCSPWRPDRSLSAWSFWTLVREAAHAAFGGGEACSDECRCIKVVSGPHDFRRTFASRLLEQGFDIREVQTLMGHALTETTARYDKRSKDVLFAKRRNTTVLATI